jgi:hypothetical protein
MDDPYADGLNTLVYLLFALEHVEGCLRAIEPEVRIVLNDRLEFHWDGSQTTVELSDAPGRKCGAYLLKPESGWRVVHTMADPDSFGRAVSEAAAEYFGVPECLAEFKPHRPGIQPGAIQLSGVVSHLANHPPSRGLKGVSSMSACFYWSALCNIQLDFPVAKYRKHEMPRRCLFTFTFLSFLCALSAWGNATAQDAGRSGTDNDDSAIYAAVLRYAYRSDVYGPGRSPEPAEGAVAMLQDSTVTLCPSAARGIPYSHSLGKEDLDKCFMRPDPIVSAKDEAELREAIFEGCAASKPIDVSRIEGAIPLVPDSSRVTGPPHHPIDSRDYVALSRPGYSREGYAIVYGEHHCLRLCGSASLFLLVRSDEGWEVIRRALLWIS